MRKTMKAVVKTHDMGKGAELREVTIPEVGPGDVLVQVEKAAVCGSDKHRYYWESSMGKPNFTSPLIIGHEMSGKVIEVGTEVKRANVGTRIAAETHVPCGTCLQCLTGNFHICHNLEVLGLHRDGCFSDYIVLPQACTVPVPEELPPDETVLLEPMGVAYHALSKVKVGGNSVLIVGCGPIGLMSVQLAKILGASCIIAAGKRSLQREMAGSLGANIVTGPDPDEVKAAVNDATDGYGVGVALEMSGNPIGVETAFGSVRKGGELVLVGMPKAMTFDFQRYLVRKELRVHGQHGRRMYDTWVDLLGLLESGALEISGYVTADVSLEEFDRAFELANGEDQIKVLLTP
jgi:threonine 3-dehydrogenase